MTPFMKNHNDHMQKMAKSAARQEKIASQYRDSQKKLPNQAHYEKYKDEEFDRAFSKQKAISDYKAHDLSEEQKNRQAANANQVELMKQIKAREQERQLQKGLKYQQERIFVQNDLKIKQEHQIMLAQRRHLEK